ncbi:MAG: TonB-dependent receptor [Daejeonella sp.]
MKITFFLLFTLLIQVSAAGYAQKITFTQKDATLKQVFNQINKQTGYNVFWSPQLIKNSPRLNVDFNETPLENALSICLNGLSLTYIIDEKTIIIKKKEGRVLGSMINAIEIEVRGRVVDQKGQSLPGVSIKLKGMPVGTVTNSEGNYTIKLPDGNGTLVFSFLGFASREIPVNGRSQIDVTLQEESSKLNEVVVIGYGTVKKSDLTGAVSSVKGDILTAQSNANPIMALQGAASGVQVVGSGEPGTSPSVKIRGVGTTGNSNPLYVVDGMMLENVQYLNNNDIESIEVLKDASATAIYGSRGANGVILITTKKGTSSKPSFAVNFYEGIQSPQPFSLVTAAQYGQLINEGNIGQGKAPVYADPSTLGKGTQWFDEVTNPSPIRDYQIMFNQKTNNSSYYVSIGYHGNPGIVDKSKYNRYTFRLNNQYNLTDKISIGHNFSFVSSHKDNINTDNVFGWLYRVKPTVPVYDSNGEFNNVEVGSNGNVVAKIFYTNDYTNLLATVGNAYFNVNFLKDFTFRSSIGVNVRKGQSTNFNPVFQVGTGNQKNEVSSLNKDWRSQNDWLWENTLTYDKTFGLHHINVLGGYTAQENNEESFSGSRSYLFAQDPSLWYLDAGASAGQKNGNSGSANAIVSNLFRTNYSFDNKYIITATMRSDASSKFRSGKRIGYFPSVALAWNLSNEGFMKNIDWISAAKIRGSWGRIGNDKIGDYRYYALATTSLSDYAIFNDLIQRGSTITGLVNSDVTWEISESKNAGLELGLLNNRLTMELDYYSRITKDMLVNVGVPKTAGLNSTEGNVGSVENKGIDMKLTWKDIRNNFRYNFTATGTTVNNKVLDLGTTKAIVGGWRGVTRTTVGQPIGYFYGYKTIGVFQNQAEIDAHPKQLNVKPGDLIFADVNGDNKIDAADRTKIGESIPKALVGLNLMFGYKNFDLGIDMYGSFGSDIFNAKSLESYSSEDNYSTEYLARWTGPGTSNTVPRITFGGQNKEFSTSWLGNGSFWKVQNIKLAYTIPPSLLNKIRIQQAQIYLSGNNIHYFSNYNGPTPEIGGPALAAGIDRQVYPLVNVYKIGATITF